ncbi:Alpha/Beta hydrolase protein [Crucibulum laeve]|uniref:Alpha/Beta hydrolase protein n=1 Tax=Crucibulum laeve TaxID=68775 RepID=A0A5C3LN47_9AGAR|nr:Alpha/Beta hydrolase protein [Crucibulum laeve]
MRYKFSSPISDIQGYIARDEERKEIVVALRGSVSMIDFLMDAEVILVPLICPGVHLPHGAKVHSGFLLNWDSVALQVIEIVSLQLKKHPGFSIVTTGHSLGGSLALLAAVTLQQNFPDSKVRTFSYGSPRTGNDVFAEFVNENFGPRAHRVVHTSDGVPTIIPRSLGYHHHGIEYWQHSDPPCEDTIFQCSPDGEDPKCSASVPTRGINPAHLTYFGIPVSTPFCF